MEREGKAVEREGRSVELRGGVGGWGEESNMGLYIQHPVCARGYWYLRRNAIMCIDSKQYCKHHNHSTSVQDWAIPADKG